MTQSVPHTDPDAEDVGPALVDAMRTRVVTRKTQDYGNRKAGPGRPKGIKKPNGSGKKAGTPNLWTPEYRAWLADRSRPFELLAAICMGEEIEDAGTKRKPTLSERMRAAETLGRKLLPDLAATTLSGPHGGPIEVSDTGELSDFEVARRVAFLLASGLTPPEIREPSPTLQVQDAEASV